MERKIKYKKIKIDFFIIKDKTESNSLSYFYESMKNQYFFDEFF